MIRERIISTILFCLYLAAVAYLCFAKPEDVPQMHELWFGLPSDKVGHFLMFAPFPLLGYLVFAHKDMKMTKAILLLSTLAICGLGLAIGTEQIQAQLAYRSAETEDLLADGAGLAVGSIAAFIYIIAKRK